MPVGTVISELKGSMANLTNEEDQELKRRDFRNSDIRRDFSVIHSKQMKKNHLFLGPARFVNVSLIFFFAKSSRQCCERHSMIVRTIVNFFARESTSLSGSYDL
jgi:hypothetical protein